MCQFLAEFSHFPAAKKLKVEILSKYVQIHSWILKLQSVKVVIWLLELPISFHDTIKFHPSEEISWFIQTYYRSVYLPSIRFFEIKTMHEKRKIVLIHLKSTHKIQHTCAINYFVQRALSSTQQLQRFFCSSMLNAKNQYTKNGLLFPFSFCVHEH